MLESSVVWLSNGRLPTYKQGGLDSPSVQWGARQVCTSAGMSKPQPSRHIQPAACFWTALELRMFFYIFKDKENMTETICSSQKISTTWPCLGGLPLGLSGTGLNISTQYKVTTCNTAINVSKNKRHIAKFRISCRWTFSLSLKKQKTNMNRYIWVILATRYLQNKKLLALQFHVRGIWTERKKYFPFTAKGLDGSRRKSRTWEHDSIHLGWRHLKIRTRRSVGIIRH